MVHGEMGRELTIAELWKRRCREMVQRHVRRRMSCKKTSKIDRSCSGEQLGARIQGIIGERVENFNVVTATETGIYGGEL